MLRQLVRQKAPQADAQQYLSLDTMTAQLVEVQAGLRVVDSRHLGEDVPAAEHLAVVESAAATYSSVKQHQVPMSAMSAYSIELGLPAEQLRDTSTITCRF